MNQVEGRRPWEGRPSWWAPGVGEREVLLSLATTPGPLPAAVASRLAEGGDPASLLRVHSPEPGEAAARLDALGLRLLTPADDGWPLAATPPDPPCAWLFVSGPARPRRRWRSRWWAAVGPPRCGVPPPARSAAGWPGPAGAW
jgi:hypothetical protein